MTHGYRVAPIRWLSTGALIAVVAVLAAPWPTPSPQAALRVFAKELLTVDSRGSLPLPGIVEVSDDAIVITSRDRSQPSVHILTSPVSFDVQLSVAVAQRDPSVFPFQVRIWDAAQGETLEAWYDAEGRIVAGTRDRTGWREVVLLGRYLVGWEQSWRVTRDAERVRIAISGQGENATYEVDAEKFPALFDGEALTLTLLSTSPEAGSSVAVIRQPLISLNTQTRYGTTVQGRKFMVAVILAAVLSLLALARNYERPIAAKGLNSPDLFAVLGLLGIGLVLGWALSTLPGHPYDARTTKVWSYAASRHGPAAVPGISLLATEGAAHGGQPYGAVPYPYPPLLTYLYWGAGLMTWGGQVERVSKMTVMVTVVLGAILLFGLLRSLHTSRRIAFLTAVAYVANPAILFDAVVWGQTDAVVALFLLLGTAGIFLESPVLLLTGVALASLTKQTGLLFGLVILVLGFARFRMRAMIRGLRDACLIVFLVLTPLLMSGMHPAAVYRPLLTAVDAFGVAQTTSGTPLLSQSMPTLWSTVAGLKGVKGFERLTLTDLAPLFRGSTYFAISRMLFALVALMIILLCLKTSGKRPGRVFLLIAAYSVAVVVILTRVSPRYLHFGVLFALAATPWMARWIGRSIVGVLTGTMLVSMWGMLALVAFWYPGLVPVFRASRHWLNGGMAAALTNDSAITIVGLINIGTLLALLAVLLRDPGATEDPPFPQRHRSPGTRSNVGGDIETRRYHPY